MYKIMYPKSNWFIYHFLSIIRHKKLKLKSFETCLDIYFIDIVFVESLEFKLEKLRI